MIRNVVKSEAFEAFYAGADERTQTKIDYILQIVQTVPVVHAKFIKKLENTDYYEMRISVDNEYRVILFTIDNPNFSMAKEILLLNGFIKKSTKDYRAQIEIANKILSGYVRQE